MDEAMRELYQDTILQHNKSPRNFRVIPDATHQLEGFNPLCGDRLTLYVKLEADRVADIAFQGHGCAISTSSASMMTEAIKGKTKAEAERMFQAFHHLILRDGPAPKKEEIGKLAVFSGVGEFPARVKCATLCWHTLKSELDGKVAGKVSTE